MKAELSREDVHRIFVVYTIAVHSVKRAQKEGNDWDVPNGWTPESIQDDRNRICKQLGYWNETRTKN